MKLKSDDSDLERKIKYIMYLENSNSDLTLENSRLERANTRIRMQLSNMETENSKLNPENCKDQSDLNMQSSKS